MNILIIGGSGVIGSKLVKYFMLEKNQVEYTYLTNKMLGYKAHRLDITLSDPTKELITSINPDIVIHCAALTNVDLCETNKTLADTINVEGTKNIIEGCKITNSKLVYVSTCFVFDGSKKLYYEEDVRVPATHYGFTKSKAEELVERSSLSNLILRTDQPYCWVEKWQHTNSPLRVINTLKTGNTLNEIVDWYNNPTYVPDFVRGTAKLLEYNEKGVFQVVGPDHCNRYQWSLLTADIFELEKKLITPITSDTLNLPAKRVNVNLSNNKLFQKTGIKMKGIKDGLIEMQNKKEL